MAHTEHDSHHIIPLKILLQVFGALVVLTILTVVASRLDLGMLDVPVALGIAGMKTALVVLFFMALKYDKGVNSLVFTVGAVFVVIFLFFTLLDVVFRGDLGNVATETISAEERRAERLRNEEPADSLLRIAPADYPDASAANSEREPAAEESPSGNATGEDPPVEQ